MTRILGFIPARGGSKSIPLKNICNLGKYPLIAYQIMAAKAANHQIDLVCSTDSKDISDIASQYGVNVINRPQHLSSDVSPVADCLYDYLLRSDVYYDLALLLQPTSPFLLPDHIDSLIKRINSENHFKTAQTICKVPHNNHAFNQRTIVNDEVRFIYAEQRKQAYNKQLKPVNYKFGNLLCVKVPSFMESHSLFQPPSAYVEIENPYDFDLDDANDLILAQCMLELGAVELVHLT